MASVELWGKLRVWEYGRKRLGYGTYDPEGDEPYQKWAGLEAHKLFLVRRRRHIKVADFLIAVDYCQRHHITIENAVWVFQYVAQAKAEDKVNRLGDTEQQIRSAIDYEHSLDRKDTPHWIARLARAQGPYRKEVLESWEQSLTQKEREDRPSR